MNPGGKRAWQWAHRAAAEDAHEVPERREGLALRQGGELHHHHTSRTLPGGATGPNEGTKRVHAHAFSG